MKTGPGPCQGCRPSPGPRRRPEHWQALPGSGRQQLEGPSPWLVTFNAALVPSDVEDSELSMRDLARENEDWDSEDDDRPDHESR